MARRFARQGIEIQLDNNSDATRNQLNLRANANLCRRFTACQSVEKSDHDYALMAHDDCFKNSRMVIPSSDPLRGALKRSLNSPLVRFIE
jgi:hypothetical protein